MAKDDVKPTDLEEGEAKDTGFLAKIGSLIKSSGLVIFFVAVVGLESPTSKARSETKNLLESTKPSEIWLITVVGLLMLTICLIYSTVKYGPKCLKVIYSPQQLLDFTPFALCFAFCNAPKSISANFMDADLQKVLTSMKTVFAALVFGFTKVHKYSLIQKLFLFLITMAVISYTMVSTLDKDFGKQTKIRKEFVEISQWQVKYDGRPLCFPGADSHIPGTADLAGQKCVGFPAKQKDGKNVDGEVQNMLNANLIIPTKDSPGQDPKNYKWNMAFPIIIGEKLYDEDGKGKEVAKSTDPLADQLDDKGEPKGITRVDEKSGKPKPDWIFAPFEGKWKLDYRIQQAMEEGKKIPLKEMKKHVESNGGASIPNEKYILHLLNDKDDKPASAGSTQQDKPPKATAWPSWERIDAAVPGAVVDGKYNSVVKKNGEYVIVENTRTGFDFVKPQYEKTKKNDDGTEKTDFKNFSWGGVKTDEASDQNLAIGLSLLAIHLFLHAWGSWFGEKALKKGKHIPYPMQKATEMTLGTIANLIQLFLVFPFMPSDGPLSKLKDDSIYTGKIWVGWTTFGVWSYFCVFFIRHFIAGIIVKNLNTIVKQVASNGCLILVYFISMWWSSIHLEDRDWFPNRFAETNKKQNQYAIQYTEKINLISGSTEFSINVFIILILVTAVCLGWAIVSKYTKCKNNWKKLYLEMKEAEDNMNAPVQENFGVEQGDDAEKAPLVGEQTYIAGQASTLPPPQ